ncbi:MAG: RNA polymerase sigma factor [Xanthomonadaceae bacterium]|nr:RNA polymerase sigma factor [Xanthomonadaceae bacterium]
MMATDLQRSIDALWRIESPRVTAVLSRMLRDVGLAEDLAQDTLLTALERWPEEGVPDNPGAWLMTTAKRRGIDHLRRQKLLERKHAQLGHELASEQEQHWADTESAMDDGIGDDLLRLMFVACHPALSAEARVALTLRLLGGLSTAEIARACLQPESTIAQRIVRAKRTLARKQIAFELPCAAELRERLASILEVIYLIFNEGYTATAGDDWMRPGLCEEALRLGRVLAGLMPGEAEVHGLVALMEIHASRSSTRVDGEGRPVLLSQQNRAQWDRLLIRRGLDALERAQNLGPIGAYTLQAMIAACHARAPTAQATDWKRIVQLYDALAQLTPSPVVELNRAVAVSMAFGVQAGLDLVDALAADATLKNYHLLPSVRGDFLSKLGRLDEARDAFLQAAALTGNAREYALLQQRATDCSRATGRS